MRKIFLDIETFYSKDYTLKQMTPLEYILDPRFEMICCGVAVNDEDVHIMPQEEVIYFLKWTEKKYGDYIAISHNALFDMSILSYRYNIRPSIMVDTLSMARAALVHQIPNGRLSLDSILQYLNFEKKLTTINDVIGMHYDNIVQHNLWYKFGEYTRRDVEGCRNIFKYLAPAFTAQEFRIMDTVIRTTTEMKLWVNREKLEDYYNNIVNKQLELLKQLGYDKAEFMSNNRFATLLREHGVDPPTKISVTTKKETYAFAKTDEGMQDLLDHENENIRLLAAGRIGVKSTIEQTRTKRFLDIEASTMNYYNKPYVPVPLKYSGAHTHRLSGDWKINLQNLSARKNKKMRSAICAPEGYVLLAIDASQIEARLTAWLAQETSLLQMFKDKIDIYKEFAADIYNVKIEQVDKNMRFNGKTCILGLGFKMWAERLLYTLTNGALEFGIEQTYTIEECVRWVNRYRMRFSNIPALWDKADTVIFQMEKGNGRVEGWTFGPCVVSQLSIVLPSQLRLWYYNLRKNEEDKYVYQYGREIKHIYGGKLIENIVQALDRQCVMEAALNTEDRCRKAGIPDVRFVMQVHDENVYCIQKEHADFIRQVALEEMSRTPKWALPSEEYPFALPLAAEAKMGDNYGELE